MARNVYEQFNFEPGERVEILDDPDKDGCRTILGCGIVTGWDQLHGYSVLTGDGKTMRADSDQLVKVDPVRRTFRELITTA